MWWWVLLVLVFVALAISGVCLLLPEDDYDEDD
jgi:hypothetical protein